MRRECRIRQPAASTPPTRGRGRRPYRGSCGPDGAAASRGGGAPLGAPNLSGDENRLMLAGNPHQFQFGDDGGERLLTGVEIGAGEVREGGMIDDDRRPAAALCERGERRPSERVAKGVVDSLDKTSAMRSRRSGRREESVSLVAADDGDARAPERRGSRGIPVSFAAWVDAGTRTSVGGGWRERDVGRDVEVVVTTGVLYGDSDFAPHGHVVRLRASRPTERQPSMWRRPCFNAVLRGSCAAMESSGRASQRSAGNRGGARSATRAGWSRASRRRSWGSRPCAPTRRSPP